MRVYLNRLLIVGLSVAIVYICWVIHPPSRYEPQFQEMLQRHRLLQEKLAKDAKDPERNGCLEPTWRDYWKDPRNSTTGPAVRALSEHGSGDPDTRAFENDYPSLHQALSRPLLIGAELTAVHELSQALQAFYRAGHDLEVLADLLRLIGPGSFEFSTQGRGLQLLLSENCLEELSDVFQRSDLSSIPAGKLRSLQQALARAAFPDDAVAVAAEGDFLFVYDSLKQSKRKISPPGLWERELRLYKNEGMASIALLRDGQPAPLTPPQWGDYFWGKRSRLAWSIHTNAPPAPEAFRVATRRLAFYHLCIEVLIFRQENGTWPLDLPRLERSGYKPMPGIALEKVTFEALGDRLHMSDGDLSWDVS